VTSTDTRDSEAKGAWVAGRRSNSDLAQTSKHAGIKTHTHTH